MLLVALPLVWWVGQPRYAVRRRRDRASLGVRTALLLSLVLALASLVLRQEAQRLAVIFVLDASDSVGEIARTTQETFLRQALAGKPDDALWAGAAFAGNTLFFQPFTTQSNPIGVFPRVQNSETNIAHALNVALASFPPQTSGRIVVFSDGEQTQGDALAVARRALALGVTIDVVPLVRAQVADTRLVELVLPSQVGQGQAFDAFLTIEADAPTAAQLLLTRNGTLIEQANLTLQAGENRYTLPQQSADAGFLNYRAQLIVANDPIPQNNRLEGFTQVSGRARVLVVAEGDRASQALVTLLGANGYEVTQARADALPSQPAMLASYQSVLMVNIPATRLANAQMQALQLATRELGVGLVFVGGDESYALGGYADTPIEEMLPVSMTLRDPQRLPQLTLAYLIDTSGSMNTSDDGAYSYLELGQIAMNTSLDLLQPSDRVAIATFDNVGRWVARLQDRADKRDLQRLIGTMASGGGTDVLGGLRLVAEELTRDDAPVKHVILLTDGGATSRGLVEQAEAMARGGITLSVIAIGRTPPNFMRSLAEASGGNYHEVRDASQIPRIFAQETVLASRSYLVEGEVLPVMTARHPILTGITATPPLFGYVATSPKDNAQMLLAVGEYDDPLLSVWQYGLGRVVAFTSDTSVWARDWQAWADFGRVWGQIVSWSVIAPSEALTTRFEVRDGQTVLTVDAHDSTGAFLNGLEARAIVLAPNGTTTSTPLQQVNIGEYVGAFDGAQEGVYLVAVQAQDTQNADYRTVSGWVQTYAKEYLPQADGVELLAELARVTGGRVLTDIPAQAFAPSPTPVFVDVPLWQGLVWLALCLFVLDVAIRRLLITERDLLRAWAWVRTRRVNAPDERLSALKQAKARATESVPNASDAPAPLAPPARDTAPMPRTPAKEGDTVSSLLKKKRGE